MDLKQILYGSKEYQNGYKIIPKLPPWEDADIIESYVKTRRMRYIKSGCSIEINTIPDNPYFRKNERVPQQVLVCFDWGTPSKDFTKFLISLGFDVEYMFWKGNWSYVSIHIRNERDVEQWNTSKDKISKKYIEIMSDAERKQAKKMLREKHHQKERERLMEKIE